eukprot:7398359-Pyramimonas_sp.AAC.1
MCIRDSRTPHLAARALAAIAMDSCAAARTSAQSFSRSRAWMLDEGHLAALQSLEGLVAHQLG